MNSHNAALLPPPPLPPSPPPPSASWLLDARREIDAKAKPPGSLGLLEDWAVKISNIQQTLQPHITAARLLIFAGDHGITISNPSVSAYPREVTLPIFTDIAKGTGASAILSRGNSCELNIIDVGMDTPETEAQGPSSAASGAPHLTVTHAKVRRNSRDMTLGPALSPEERKAAEEVGADAVRRYIAGHALYHHHHKTLDESTTATTHSRLAVCIGELGIGNTTAAAALVAALTGEPAASVTGRGTGLGFEGMCLKVKVIEKALTVNSKLIQSHDPSQILEAVGGLELAAMVGAYLEAGRHRMPILVDGFVSGAAALVALHRHPPLATFLFWTHQSDEKGAAVLLQAAATKTREAGEPVYPPPLKMNLRLGEGTGALLALPLLRSACAIMREMVTMTSVVKSGSSSSCSSSSERDGNPRL
ncbi:nicotinate-nucleotide-dimethylbenzimidazole phosphoribosyltransferase [Nannochloropsis oceanica]